MNLGRLLLESKRVPEAREELQKAVDLKQGHIPAIELLIEVDAANPRRKVRRFTGSFIALSRNETIPHYFI